LLQAIPLKKKQLPFPRSWPPSPNAQDLTCPIYAVVFLEKLLQLAGKGMQQFLGNGQASEGLLELAADFLGGGREHFNGHSRGRAGSGWDIGCQKQKQETHKASKT
jgi:hypothetical protein